MGVGEGLGLGDVRVRVGVVGVVRAGEGGEAGDGGRVWPVGEDLCMSAMSRARRRVALTHAHWADDGAQRCDLLLHAQRLCHNPPAVSLPFVSKSSHFVTALGGVEAGCEMDERGAQCRAPVAIRRGRGEAAEHPVGIAQSRWRC